MNNIGRTLFWFLDGDEMLLVCNERFFAFGTLLNRLLNEKYTGKKIKFINIDFSTEKTYELHPNTPKNETYYYGGHLRFYGVFDYVNFSKLNEDEQIGFVWKTACKYLSASAQTIKNDDLLQACDYAYNKGLELGLNPDYVVVENSVTLYGWPIKASLWINFIKDEMYSKLTLEKAGEVVFEKNIDKTRIGIEFFLEMYKRIECDGSSIIIKGHRDVDYLPLKIPIDASLIQPAL